MRSRTCLFAAMLGLGMLGPGVGLPSVAQAAIEVRLESMEVASGSNLKLARRLVGTLPSLVDDTSTRHLINAADCSAYRGSADPRVTIGWSWSNAGRTMAITEKAQYRIRLQPPGKSCDTSSLTAPDPASGCIELYKDDSLTTLDGKQSFSLNLEKALGDTKCDASTETSAEVFFVMQYKDSTSLQQLTEYAALKLSIDLAAPEPPTITSVSGGEQNIRLSWKQADPSTTKSRVYWSPINFDPKRPGDVCADCRSDVLTATSYQISGLHNEQTYYVAVVALDDAENESAAREVLEAMAVPVQDLWQYYKASGGASEGGYGPGCSGGPGGGGSDALVGLGLLALCAMLLLLLGRRAGTRGGRLVLVAGLCTLALVSPELARATSPRTASMDLRLASYLPAIDSEFADNGSGRTPYADVMKDGAWLKDLSIDWLLLDGFGELSVGVSAGYWSKQGKGKAIGNAKTADQTTLLVVPLTLDLSYRFTVLAERAGFPLIPYGRVGMGYALWWIDDGLDQIATYTDEKGRHFEGRGGVAGLHVAGGLRLLLDVFEPQAAKGFDMELGVNHSYLFIEYQRLSLNNFGRDPKVLDLSDDLLHFGLAFDL